MSYRDATPLYPLILVERLPRNSMTANNIVLPDDRNKPVHEGVVLRTWEPRVKTISYSGIIEEGGVDILRGAKSFSEEPSVQPGDIVLFPHFAGVAHEDPAEANVLFVKEHEILGRIERDAWVEATAQSELVTALLGAFTANEKVPVTDIAQTIMQRVIVVPRRSFTQSGKNTTGVI